MLSVRSMLLAAILFGGCGSQRPADAPDEDTPPVVPEAAPATRAEFLALLRPIPGQAAAVEYRIEGEGGLEGTLRLAMQSGGLRRSDWRLALPVAGGDPVTTEITRISTPDRTSTRVGPGEGVVHPVALGALADGYLRLSEPRREAVVSTIRRFHADLRAARQQHPGPRRRVAGQACTTLQMAAQRLCLWEPAGIPLHYRGAALELSAVEIERAPTLSAQTFALPGAPAEGPPKAVAQTAQTMLEGLVAGDFSVLTALVDPRGGLVPPIPRDGVQ